MSETGTTPPSSITDQLAFARFNFDNCQSLIRFSDTKTGAIMTLVIFLGASAMPVARDAVHRLSAAPCWRLVASWVFVASGVGFLCAFALLLWAAHNVVNPRGARHYTQPVRGRDLIWQEHVLAHRSQEEYFNAIAVAEPILLLRNLTDQVYELASISRDKMAALAVVQSRMWWVFGCWFVNVLGSFLLSR